MAHLSTILLRWAHRIHGLMYGTCVYHNPPCKPTTINVLSSSRHASPNPCCIWWQYSYHTLTYSLALHLGTCALAATRLNQDIPSPLNGSPTATAYSWGWGCQAPPITKRGMSLAQGERNTEQDSLRHPQGIIRHKYELLEHKNQVYIQRKYYGILMTDEW